MKKLLLSVIVLGGIILLFSDLPAGAADAGPFLVGPWRMSETVTPPEGAMGIRTSGYIINPTASTVTSCCCIYDNTGSKIECTGTNVVPNQSWYVSFESKEARTVKCIAMPQWRQVLDPSVVIAGFLNEWMTVGDTSPWGANAKFFTASKWNMSAVPLNMKTTQDFWRVANDCSR